MIKESLQSFFGAFSSLLKDKRSLAVFLGLYAVLLGALYGFIAIREATVWQVLLTLLFIGAAPIVFFLLQAAIIDHAQTSQINWGRILRASTKLALTTIPIILIGWGMFWLLNKWQRHFPAPFFQTQSPIAANGVNKGPIVPPTHWPSVAFSAARVAIFGVFLPLALIQLWVQATGRELLSFFRGGARVVGSRWGGIVGRAFAPGSVIIYALGLILFAVLPYVGLFVHKPAKGAWTDIVILSVRLAIVLALVFIGWAATLTAFAKRDTERPPLLVQAGGETATKPPAEQPAVSVVDAA